MKQHSPSSPLIPVSRYGEAKEAARLSAVHHRLPRVQVEAGHAADHEGDDDGHQGSHDGGHEVTMMSQNIEQLMCWHWVTMLIRESPARCGSAAASELFPLSEEKAPAPGGGRLRRQDTWWRRLHFQALDLKIYKFWTMISSIFHRLYANVTTWRIRNIESRGSLK